MMGVLAVAIMCPAAARGQAMAMDDMVVNAPTDPFASLGDPPVGAAATAAGALIRLDQAHTAFPTINGAGYTIAIIDSGVDYTHPAMAGRYVGGYDFVNNDDDPDDDFYHGTHVAGISVSNDATYTGMAPQAGYAALKVLNSSGSGHFGNVERALQWVIDNREEHNIVAVNMSLTTAATYNNPPIMFPIIGELSALKNAGVFIAAAVGNNWVDKKIILPGDILFPLEGVGYPAADASVVAVGSVWTGDFGEVTWRSGAIDYTTAADRVVSHSNRSETMLDILAPGTFVTSTAYDWEGANDDFAQISGTSVASPAVAGLAVLIRQAIEKSWDPVDWPSGSGWQDTILEIMQDNSVIVHDGDDEEDNVANLDFDFPRIDVFGALSAVAVPEPFTLSSLDIRPGSDKNSVNLNSVNPNPRAKEIKAKAMLPVSILTTNDFEPLIVVDLEKPLLFGDLRLIEDWDGTDEKRPVEPIRINEDDVNGDGWPDLNLLFSIPELLESGALDPFSVEVSLTGTLLADSGFISTTFIGTDDINIVSKRRGHFADALDESGLAASGSDMDINAIPEPSTFVLLCMGAFSLLVCALRRRR